MAEIIHLAPGEQPELDRPCAVFEWKPGGEIEVRDMPGVGRWQLLPPEWFDSYVRSANRMATEMRYERVYIIGRPE